MNNMGMLQHGQQKRPKLDRGSKVVVKNQVKRNEVLNEGEITFPVNVRVDNHIRNEISALINLGLADSAKDMVRKLVEEKVDSLGDDQKKRYEKMYSILEEKDYLRAKTNVK